MAAKVGNLIGSETATTFWYSIINTRTSISSASNTTSSISASQERTRYMRIRIRHFSKPPFPLVQANSGPSDSNSNSNEPNSPFPSTFQDDLKYLLKLLIGSVLGAAVIKYGSAAIPTITRPDITVALSIISTPSIIAVLLLAKESRED
ncbi:hypothetical protein KSS87_003055 [Heliosperma pusillum]|nr:hypothetical protein KSS87_003055 [Heliosperma pusillum]